jgi:hypothetical protein
MERHSEQGNFGFSNWVYSNAYSIAFSSVLGLNINQQGVDGPCSII